MAKSVKGQKFKIIAKKGVESTKRKFECKERKIRQALEYIRKNED